MPPLSALRLPVKLKGFEVEKYLPAKEARRFDRFIHFGVAAGLMALEDSGLVIDDELALRAGCAIGSGIGGFAGNLPQLSDVH